MPATLVRQYEGRLLDVSSIGCLIETSASIAPGTVGTLEATIDEAGNVKDLKVIGSRPLLDKAAIDAVSKWRYTPTRLNGVAVPIILTVRVTFALR